MAKMVPSPLTPAGARISFTRSIGSVEDFRIGDAHHLHVEKFAERPAGVVIGGFLRIVGAPILVIEQRVGDAGIGLVHADDVASGGKFFGRGGGADCFFFRVLGRWLAPSIGVFRRAA